MTEPQPDSTGMVPNGSVQVYVAEYGKDNDTPVLLVHGWPDSGHLWRNQIPALVAAGYRVIVPDLRGLGQSDRPGEVADYEVARSVSDLVAVLDAFEVPSAHVIGHDWGAMVAWMLATFQPARVRTLAALSVPHPSAPRTHKQAEMGWYQLFFQFEGVAEATIQADDWAWLRWFTRGHGDLDRAIADLSRPGALSASLRWYRANLAPKPPGPARELPKISAPTLGVWSTGDYHLDGARMEQSGAFVTGPWRYEVIADASHWIPLDAPDRLTELLLEWLAAAPVT